MYRNIRQIYNFDVKSLNTLLLSVKNPTIRFDEIIVNNLILSVSNTDSSCWYVELFDFDVKSVIDGILT